MSTMPVCQTRCRIKWLKRPVRPIMRCMCHMHHGHVSTGLLWNLLGCNSVTEVGAHSLSHCKQNRKLVSMSRRCARMIVHVPTRWCTSRQVPHGVLQLQHIYESGRHLQVEPRGNSTQSHTVHPRRSCDRVTGRARVELDNVVHVLVCELPLSRIFFVEMLCLNLDFHSGVCRSMRHKRVISFRTAPYATVLTVFHAVDSASEFKPYLLVVAR